MAIKGERWSRYQPKRAKHLKWLYKSNEGYQKKQNAVKIVKIHT
jgi:hypothetical protein